MEAVVGVERSNEDFEVEKISSPLSAPMTVADPVVYKLVRVAVDGRFVPATDDEVMEVEEFLVDDKTEKVDVPDAEKTSACISTEESAAEKIQLEELKEGLSLVENAEASEEKVDAVKSTSEIKEQEIIPSSGPTAHESSNSISEDENPVESSKPLDGQPESGSSTSSVCNNSKPDFSKLEGEICLDKLSIRELHDLFKATFGRETTVKDKTWLKRRIAMGLIHSCDIPTTTFTIKDNKLVNVGSIEESCKDENRTISEELPVKEQTVVSKSSLMNHGCKVEDNSPVIGQMEDHITISGKRCNDCTEFDMGSDERAAKRIRKPTKRYIEELSKSEPIDSAQKVQHPVRDIGLRQTLSKICITPVKNVALNERVMLTRLDSLGGSGVQIPCVSRVRRSRPRKNIKALMKFQPSYVGMATQVVKKDFVVPRPQVDSQSMDKVAKSRHACEQTEQPLTSEAEKEEQCSAIITVQLGKNLGPKQTDSSDDVSDENAATVPTIKGGMRRKHHRAWSLVEVMKLVEGVSKCGAGRWSEIKRLVFSSYSYRTSVDLKDKWRNLLKASLAQTPLDEGLNSRKHATSVPIPASILLRVRELSEMHSSQPPSILGSNSPAGVNGRSGPDSRLGYL